MRWRGNVIHTLSPLIDRFGNVIHFGDFAPFLIQIREEESNQKFILIPSVKFPVDLLPSDRRRQGLSTEVLSIRK